MFAGIAAKTVKKCFRHFNKFNIRKCPCPILKCLLLTKNLILSANVCKQNVTRFPYEIARLAQDIAGGLMVTLPSEKDINHPVTGPIVRKYFAGREGVDVMDRFKIMRLIENLTMGTAAVGYLTESLHGAGSPQAQRVMISRQSNMEGKKELAKAIVHIED